MFLKKKEEEMSKKEKERFLIDPEGMFKMIWDHFQIILIVYLSTASPFKMAFFEEDAYPTWNIVEYVIDFFILLDMILTFFTPVWVKHDLKDKHSEIAKEYLSFWFWLDLLSIFPLAEIMTFLKMSGSVAKYS